MTAHEGMIVEHRHEFGAAPPAGVRGVERLGGQGGWPYAQLLWRYGACSIALVGGVGMRLGRRDPARCGSGRAGLLAGRGGPAARRCCACGRRCGSLAGPGSSTR